MTDEGTLYCDNLLCEGSQSTTEINMQTVYRLQQLCQGRTLFGKAQGNKTKCYRNLNGKAQC